MKTSGENNIYVNTLSGEASQFSNGSEGIEYIGKIATESVHIQIPVNKHKPFVKIKKSTTIIAQYTSTVFDIIQKEDDSTHAWKVGAML